MMNSMGRPLEPGLLRIFRYFTGIAMIYFGILWIYGLLSSEPNLTLQLQSQLNLFINGCLLIYLTIPWLEGTLKKWYLPIALIGYTIATVFSNLLYLFDPNADLYIIVARSWALVPILVVPLVIIAWQYSLPAVLVFTIFTNAIELIILIIVVRDLTFTTLPILGMPLIKAFAFGTVGYIVEQLVDTQRRQRRKLIMTNIQLSQYANTLDHLATSRERNRLARELHDTLAHTLSGVAVNLEALKTMLPPEQTEIQKMLDHSLTATRTGLEETRRTLQDLRARPLEDLGLSLAVTALVETLSERTGIQSQVNITQDLPTLPPDVEQSLYRITQEALENVARHANAKELRLELSTDDHWVKLIIQDDGMGMDRNNKANLNQFGITGMKERAAVIGADLQVDSELGCGTTVSFKWERINGKSPDL
jgi:signal transduction histidine kinase